MEESRNTSTEYSPNMGFWVIGGLLLVGAVVLWHNATSKEMNIGTDKTLIADLANRIII